MLINIVFCFAVLFPILRIKHELINLVKNLLQYNKLDIHNKDVFLVDLPVIRFEDLQERRHREVEEMSFMLEKCFAFSLKRASQRAKVCPKRSTLPDLAYAVSRLRLHYDRYPAVIEGYNDANWISDIKNSRSTSRYVFTLGRAAISWKSSKQTVIAKPTME
ncbi:hypothetical protein Tco_1065724 [Tanacetum coccineum]|uniref:Uncharacterized protein n=1 Tax=Tanacetum coccineum TaxID=301880 RepID=A0ABQ5AK08_9ASTR